jgi:hypothetical protein
MYKTTRVKTSPYSSRQEQYAPRAMLTASNAYPTERATVRRLVRIDKSLKKISQTSEKSRQMIFVDPDFETTP